MAGHSKWANIKRRKGAEDAKRGKIFTRLARDITVAARAGGGNPDANPSLRIAVTRAKAANMPKDNIERAIKKGTGELGGGEVDELTYEAYAPNGIPLLINCVTDNRNRTLAELRRIFNKYGGNMAEPGAVSWMFDNKGYIAINRTESLDPDDVFMMAIDAGADEIEINDEQVEIYTAADALHEVTSNLAGEDYDIAEARLTQVPKNEIDLAPDATMKVMNVIELLEDLDDVDEVFSGLAMSDEVLASISSDD